MSVTSDDGGDEEDKVCPDVDNSERLLGVGIHPKIPKLDANGKPAAAAATAAAEYPAIDVVLAGDDDASTLEEQVIGKDANGDRTCDDGDGDKLNDKVPLLHDDDDEGRPEG